MTKTREVIVIFPPWGLWIFVRRHRWSTKVERGLETLVSMQLTCTTGNLSRAFSEAEGPAIDLWPPSGGGRSEIYPVSFQPLQLFIEHLRPLLWRSVNQFTFLLGEIVTSVHLDFCFPSLQVLHSPGVLWRQRPGLLPEAEQADDGEGGPLHCHADRQRPALP